MRWPKFIDRRINLGYLLAIPVVVFGYWQIRFQEQQTEIARKALEVKVQDLSELTQSLRREIIERKMADLEASAKIFKVLLLDLKRHEADLHLGVFDSITARRVSESMRTIAEFFAMSEDMENCISRHNKRQLFSAIGDLHGAMLSLNTARLKNIGLSKQSMEKHFRDMNALFAGNLPHEQRAARMAAIKKAQQNEYEASLALLKKEVEKPFSEIGDAERRIEQAQEQIKNDILAAAERALGKQEVEQIMKEAQKKGQLPQR